jgi:hypothetical protein
MHALLAQSKFFAHRHRIHSLHIGIKGLEKFIIQKKKKDLKKSKSLIIFVFLLIKNFEEF